MPKPSGYPSDLVTTDKLSEDIKAFTAQFIEDAAPIKIKFSAIEKLETRLISYIVRRDHKVHNHAYKLGKEQQV